MQFLRARLLSFVPTFLGALVLVFLLMRIVPGDPAAAMLGASATPDSIAALRSQMGLDKPLTLQFVDYFSGLIHLDLGRSLALHVPVTQLLAQALGPTLLLTICATFISVLIGIPIGVIAALRRGRWVDYLATGGVLLGISLPAFVPALLLLVAFTLVWPILPSAGAGSSPAEVGRALVLPAIATGLGTAGIVARITRASLLSVFAQDYVRTARAKGLRKLTVLDRHALKNALIPVLTVVGLNVSLLLGGVVVTETVFTRPGLGRLLLDAINARDYVVIEGVMVVSVVIVLVLNLAVDALYGLLDPRVRG